ncbi:uncharacterized protein THITE_13894, partial [Thermothielavioides terrestris NRRL 8126]
TVDVKRNPSYRPNGPAEYARALKKWGAKVPGALHDSLLAMRDTGTNTSAFGEVGAKSVHDDREYVSSVGFGTPSQWLDVTLDTGSSDVWVFSSETRLSLNADRPRWVIENSTTAKRVENATWSIVYADGSIARGNVWTDTISLGGTTVPNATLESAVNVSPELSGDRDSAGVFGLAYSLPTGTSPQQPAVLPALLQHLPQALFTVDLRHGSNASSSSSAANNSAYTFGYIDSSRHLSSSPIQYTPLLPNATYWHIAYNGLHLGGHREWYLSSAWSAGVDTGTALLLLGRFATTLYYGAVPGARQNWNMGGLWEFPCDLRDGNGTAVALPDLDIGFPGGAKGDGLVATIPGRYLNHTVMEDNTTMCMGGLQEWRDANGGILGDVFLKAVYAVFDVGGRRVGFAAKEL